MKTGCDKLMIHIEVDSRMPIDAEDLKEYLRYRLNFTNMMTINRIMVEPLIISSNEVIS